MVARQYELSPVTNWAGSVNGQSFALNQASIPAHTQTAFGKDMQATFVDYFNYSYTTGNIAKTTLTGLKSNAVYHLHRNTGQFYEYHNPDENVFTHAEWTNTLTLDRVGMRGFDWAFAPNNPDPLRRGYALNTGVTLETTGQAFAWTLWVR